MKKHRIFGLFFLVCGTVFTAYCESAVLSSKPWHLLEQGKAAYEKREFGEAMLLFAQARELHKRQVLDQYNYLFSALKSYQVRAAGDLINDVYRTLKKREDYDACAILDEIFLRHSPEFFDKSISKLMKWLKKSEVYPECDYLIGKVYEIEGEYRQAFTSYQSSWNARDFLYIPDMRFEIIYALSHICGLMEKTDEQEKYLLLILTEDPVFGTTNNESATLRAMMHTIKKEKTIEKFFSLYRHHNNIALRAYIELTELYVAAGEDERAFRTALLGADIAVTYLSGVLKKTDFTYVYTDFSDLLMRVGGDSNILGVTESKNIWRIFLQFAGLLQKKGCVMQAADLYTKLAQHCPVNNYAKEAEYKLSKITQ